MPPTELEKAKERLAQAIDAQKKAVQDFDKKNNECSTLVANAKKLEGQKKELEDQAKAASAAKDECAKALASLTDLKKFAEADSKIAERELAQKQAEDELAKLPADQPEAVKAAAEKKVAEAKERVTKEKEWTGYTELKKAADKAKTAVEKAEAERKYLALKTTLEAKIKQFDGDIERKNKDKTALADKAKVVETEVTKLANEKKKLEVELAAL